MSLRPSALRLVSVPEISRFYGIRVMMYWNDHPPAHFHAEYSGDEALVGVQPIRVLEGDLPRRARSLVYEWAAEHQEELLRCWELAREPAPLPQIAPLE
jgi:hypothetical protein